MSVAATTLKCRGCGAEVTFPDEFTLNGEILTAARMAIRAQWCIGSYGHLCPTCWEPFHEKPERPAEGEGEPGKLVDKGKIGIYHGNQGRVFVVTCAGCRSQVEMLADKEQQAADRALISGWKHHKAEGWCCKACSVFVASVHAGELR